MWFNFSWFKNKIFPSILAWTAKYGMRLILFTCRIDIKGLGAFLETAKTSPCILALWHSRLVVMPEVMHRFASCFSYTAIISQSRDAEPLARLTKSYKIGRVLRVAHNRRRLALSQMIALLKAKDSVLIITPDGPRGPSFSIKPGIIAAALEANAKIVPFSWHASSFWQMSTWDQMIIPKPFCKLQITFGNEISLDPDKTMEENGNTLHFNMVSAP